MLCCFVIYKHNYQLAELESLLQIKAKQSKCLLMNKLSMKEKAGVIKQPNTVSMTHMYMYMDTYIVHDNSDTQKHKTT